MRNRKRRLECVEEELEQLELDFTKRIATIKHHIRLLKEQELEDNKIFSEVRENELNEQDTSVPNSWEKVFKELERDTGMVKPYIPVVTVYGCPAYEPFTGKPLYETEPYTFSNLEDMKNEEE
ncbi:MAG: hypothetical protein J6V44_14880 [Methanobrevibacter sp.]|nr:hypothetical protein [Methanobrevibacter sp.]